MAKDLTAAERLLTQAYPAGRVVDLRVGDSQLDDPAGHMAWEEGRIVRAEVVAALLLGSVPVETGRVARLRLRGARITGDLDLASADVPVAVEFQGCAFDRGVSFAEVTARSLRFVNCHLPYLDLDTIALRNHLELVRSHLGPLSLYNAHVGGQIDLSGACLSATGQAALNAELLSVTGSLYAYDLVVHGAIEMLNATVGGQFVLDRAQLICPQEVAFAAAAVSVGGTLYCRDARVEGLSILRGARIGGSLDLSRTTLERRGGEVLSASRISIGHDLTAEGMNADGGIRLHGATVDGAIELRDAQVRWHGHAALDAYRLTAVGGIFCTGAFRAIGTINLPSAHIAGKFALSGTLDNGSSTALNLDGSTVEGNLEAPGVSIQGSISLWQTVVTGEVNLAGARLANPGREAVAARGLRTRALILANGTHIDGELDLGGATLGVLRDDPARWPVTVRLNSASYDALEPTLPASQRLVWLRRNPDGYLPHAYEQLSAVYRRLGHDADARTVLAAKERHRHQSSSLPAKAWGLLQDITLGYGYRPARAGAWLLMLIVLGTGVFALHPPHRVEPGGPEFNPLVYTIELLVPIVDFGQERAYQPGGAWQWLAYGLIAAGWVLASTAATGIARVVRRQ